jgi:hypothetical protein
MLHKEDLRYSYDIIVIRDGRMSGIEVAGLALGAIPVILEAIRGYRDTYDRIQDFRQALKQLVIVDATFRVCRLNFLSECRLLLNLVLSDPQLAQEMMANTEHHMWREQSLEQQLAHLLRDNSGACAVIVADTTSTIREFDTRLSKFHTSSVRLSPLSCFKVANSCLRSEICHWSHTARANLGQFHDGEEALRARHRNAS